MRTLILLLFVALPTFAAPIPWEATTSILKGKKVIVALNDGTRLEGNWLGVTPDTFQFEVQKARGPNRPSRGIHTFERSSIRKLKRQERRVGFHFCGMILGLFGGSAIVMQSGSFTAAPIVLPLAVGVGFFIGRAADKATREVQIEARP